MVNLKNEQEKLTAYLTEKSKERGYIVKTKKPGVIRLFWSREKGEYDAEITVEERGVGFIYVDITYTCHSRITKVTLEPYGNLFSMTTGIEEGILRGIENGIVREIEWFEKTKL